MKKPYILTIGASKSKQSLLRKILIRFFGFKRKGIRRKIDSNQAIMYASMASLNPDSEISVIKR